MKRILVSPEVLPPLTLVEPVKPHYPEPFDVDDDERAHPWLVAA